MEVFGQNSLLEEIKEMYLFISAEYGNHKGGSGIVRYEDIQDDLAGAQKSGGKLSESLLQEKNGNLPHF